MTDDTAWRAAYTAGLRKLADLLDTHPGVPLPHEGRSYAPLMIGVHGPGRLAVTAEALGIDLATEAPTIDVPEDARYVTGSYATVAVGGLHLNVKVFADDVDGIHALIFAARASREDAPGDAQPVRG